MPPFLKNTDKEVDNMGTTKKISGKAMGYIILLGLVVISWAIFKILTPHNFGSFSNMLNYFQASLIATVGAVGFYFVMVMGMFDFSIGANIMLSAIVGCVFATRFNMGYFGLKRPEEVEKMAELLAKTADMLEKTVDIDRLFAIAEGASELPDSDILTTTDRASELPEGSTLEKDSYGKQKVHLQKSGKRPVIAVARDEAFCFYYEDNLKALEKAGAEIVFFSPLHDGSVPKEADGLLLPGGYPELYAKELSENKTMLADIREKAELAMPIVAECGGFMYLHQTMEDTEHHVYEMAGVVPGDCFYTGKLVRFGYIELTEKESNFLPENGSIKGHEFHYFDSTANGDDCVALKPVSGKKYDCVFDKNSCFVGFPHLYYPSAPQFAENFVKKAKNYADRSEINS